MKWELVVCKNLQLLALVQIPLVDRHVEDAGVEGVVDPDDDHCAQSYTQPRQEEHLEDHVTVLIYYQTSYHRYHSQTEILNTLSTENQRRLLEKF